MGDLDDLVSRLLNVYTRGIKLLRLHRKRTQGKAKLSTGKQDEETPLIKSLRRSRSDISEAYQQESTKAPGFSNGDTKSKSSLSTILSRLDRVLKVAMESFTRGKVRRSDRETLLKLSSSSRTEIVSTFDEFSKRLSQSSSSLQTYDSRQKSSGKKRKHKVVAPAPIPITTALGPATKDGWIRPKPSRPKHRKRPQQVTMETSVPRPKKNRPSPMPSEHLRERVSRNSDSDVEPIQIRDSFPQKRTENRKSGISFASGSTKLGEIPRHRVAQLLTAAGYDPDDHSPIVVYPLAPYQPEVKPRGKLRKLFRG